MNIQFVLHADFEQPGAIASWTEEKGFHSRYCRPFAGEPLPSISSFDWLVVMGGPQSPVEVNQHPYLSDEIELIKQVITRDKMVLGFCLGAQLMGEALGASTERSPSKEVGVFPIELTDHGSADPLLRGLPSKFPVVHWHNDMPGLTEESRVLAISEGCPRQVIRYAPNAYGFQCHPEPSLHAIEGMIENCGSDLAPGKFVQSKRDLVASDFPSINRVMHHILDNLLQLHEVSAAKNP